jgi:TolB-like protein/Tfp pilus assembly protein PilF
MEGEPPTQVSTAAGAVFLSYASQDAEAAQRICEALRAAGIEVWFDKSELRGGDAWDRQIRKQIHDCSLFIPVISANTASRHEGYFRLEWDLADQRTHMIARSRAFVVPVCLDGTTEAAADVPESFQRVQWTRLPSGTVAPEFVTRVKRLMSPEPPTTARVAADATSGSSPIPLTARGPLTLRRALPATVVVLVVAALAYLLISKPWIAKPAAAPASSNATSSPAPSTAFNPPPHSVAVLPFVNLSGDKEQEYFSDGLSEELLNSLARINELQVAARTSSFYFKGEHADLATVAHKLNVASVLEGSVRRSGHVVRVTVQLSNAVTGFHLWSQTYDRDLRDVLKLQSEIANSVASALKVTLLSDVAAKVELGGTRNPKAYDAYLRASMEYQSASDPGENLPRAITGYTEAIRLDPGYALALADRSLALCVYAVELTGADAREAFDKAENDARQAVALAPELGQGHLALGTFYKWGARNFTLATEEYARALALEPGNARVLRNYGAFAVFMGRTDAGLAAARRATVVDPLNPDAHRQHSVALYYARRYDEAVSAARDLITLDHDSAQGYALLGYAYYQLGNFAAARSSCEAKLGSASRWIQTCLAFTYDKLGRHSAAQEMLGAMLAAHGDAVAYLEAEIYAQWGKSAEALQALETALRLHNPDIVRLKTDPELDPLRKEPRFQAIEQTLKFPN